MRVEPVREGTAIHRLAARSVFWEMMAEATDPIFEKEAWLATTRMAFGNCGLTIGTKATVFFCPPSLAEGAAKLPTAPIASDAAFLTSLFSVPARGYEGVLLDAAIIELTEEFPAVEAFGYRDGEQAIALLGAKPPHIGLLPVETLESAGFRVVEDHPVLPRLRVNLPWVDEEQVFFAQAFI